MRISLRYLRGFVELPAEPRQIRELLDSIGIEVKRLTPTDVDTVATVELLANRGDHYCYAGIAREIAGRTGAEVKLPETAQLETGTPPVPLRIESDACLTYTVTPLRLTGGGPGFPVDLEMPLVADDVGLGIAPVDASNLTALEFGQPTHVFDAAAVDGEIVVRHSRPGERAHLLFRSEPNELPEGTLVIADRSKVLGVAGVIGCEESKVTATTTEILLESATFDPIAVRRSSKALGLNTLASERFRRGGDPTMPLRGASRVAWCLQRFAGWQVAGPTGVAGDWRDPGRTLRLDVEAAAKFLDHPLTTEQAAERLGRYGFDCQVTEPGRAAVRVPPHRLWDVEHVADLYEDLARSIDYNVIGVTVPWAGLGTRPSTEDLACEAVDNLLVGEGFYEIYTDGFYARSDRELLGIGEHHPLWPHVEIRGAVDRRHGLLKNNCLIQALFTVDTNLKMRHTQVKAYEWTRVFRPDPQAVNGLCTETPVLWLIVNGNDRRPSWADKGRPADVHYLAGLVEQLRRLRRCDLRLAELQRHPLRDFFHPHRSAEIRLGDQTVGVLGEVHPSLLERFRISEHRPAYLEITKSALLAEPLPRSYQPPPNRLPVLRHLTFNVPQHLNVGQIVETLRSGNGHRPEIEVIDSFEYGNGERRRAITFELVFADDADLTRDAANDRMEALIRMVEQTHQEAGVKLRGPAPASPGS